jgi:hypothetical protein
MKTNATFKTYESNNEVSQGKNTKTGLTDQNDTELDKTYPWEIQNKNQPPALIFNMPVPAIGRKRTALIKTPYNKFEEPTKYLT